MTLTGEGTFEPRDRTRGGVMESIEESLGDTMAELRAESAGNSPWAGQAQAAPEMPLLPAIASATDAAMAEWAQALVEAVAARERDQFIEVAGAQNEGIRQMIDHEFKGLHDPYKVFYKGFLIGAASLLVAMLAVVVIGVLFLFATGR